MSEQHTPPAAADQPVRETEPELLPCPFCGAAPRVVEDTSYGQCNVFCVCDVEPCVVRRVGELAEAIAAWNRRAAASTPSAPPFVDVVFDGPPSHESGRFVEVEDPNGRGVRIGEWIDRRNGLWALRIPLAAAPASSSPTEEPVVHARVFEYDGAFRCLDCHAQWGALPGHPTEPPTCSPITPTVEGEEERAAGAPVIFLDIDGVLMTNESLRAGGSAHCDRACMREFNRLLKESGAEVVISSSWRILRSLEFIRGAFCAAGFQYPQRLIDITEKFTREVKPRDGGKPIYLASAHRSVEIEAWLRDNPREHFVVIDDDLDAEIAGHYVRTNMDGGLNAAHVDEALQILGTARRSKETNHG